jgi:hypothetical protein
MHFLLLVMISTFSFGAAAGERSAETSPEHAQIIRLCENPDTGEQIESPLTNAKACPEGFSAYDDLTPAYVETVKDIPPPRPIPKIAEKGAHAE